MSEEIREQVEEVLNKPECYVAFKHGYGVLLGFKDGKPVWSLRAEGLNGRELVPVFGGYSDLLKACTDNGVSDDNDWPDTGVQIRLVFTSSTNSAGQPAATIEDCANVGLPRWGGK